MSRWWALTVTYFPLSKNPSDAGFSTRTLQLMLPGSQMSRIAVIIERWKPVVQKRHCILGRDESKPSLWGESQDSSSHLPCDPFQQMEYERFLKISSSTSRYNCFCFCFELLGALSFCVACPASLVDREHPSGLCGGMVP